MPREMLNGISQFFTEDNDVEGLILIGFIKSIWAVGVGEGERDRLRAIKLWATTTMMAIVWQTRVIYGKCVEWNVKCG